MGVPKDNEFPRLVDEDPDDLDTRPMPQHERPMQERLNDAMAVLEHRHPRIHTGLRAIWGYKECSQYLERLILNGGDGIGRDRVGFKPDVVSALIVIDEIHDAINDKLR